MDVQYLCINRSNLLTGVFSTMASKESTRKNFFKKDPVHGKAKRVILKKTLQAWIPCQLYMGYNKIFYMTVSVEKESTSKQNNTYTFLQKITDHP